MLNFSTDSDLLAHEPNVFTDLPLAGQKRLAIGDAAVAGNTVTSQTGGFLLLGEGDVVLLRDEAAADVPCVVREVSDDHTLELEHAPAGLAATTGLALIARTFEPQAELVHDELMRALGIDVDDPDESLDESSILSVGLMRKLEALGTLALAYGGAVAIGGDNEAIAAKAASYQRQFRAALNGARVLIDVDGDGRADVWRTPGIGRLVRS